MSNKNYSDRKKIEAIQNLTLMNDNFMTIMFDENYSLVEYILKTVLQKDLKVIKVITQDYVVNIFYKRVIYDVYAVDAEGVHYDIEIQRSRDGASFKRARFHSSLMDSRLLDRGEKNWDKLPEQYVIFFIEKDIFGDDEPIYHIESVILKREENTRFNDGRHIIYVNCEYLKNHPEPENELDKLIHDMQCEDVKDVNKIYSKEIKDRMAYLKNPESEGFSKMSEWSESYYNEGLYDGEKKGLEQGTQKEKEATILELSKDNIPVELIAKYARTTVEEVKKILEKEKY